MPFTQYAANQIAGHTTGESSWTMPTALYAALYPGNPGAGLSGSSEFSGDGYARKEITSWGAVSNGVIANDQVEDFAAATGNWSEATHFVLFDASTSGNGIYYGALTTPQTVLSGQQYRIRVGDLVVTIATT